MAITCRHCGVWEINTLAHNYCGACGVLLEDALKCEYNPQLSKLEISSTGNPVGERLVQSIMSREKNSWLRLIKDGGKEDLRIETAKDGSLFAALRVPLQKTPTAWSVSPEISDRTGYILPHPRAIGLIDGLETRPPPVQWTIADNQLISPPDGIESIALIIEPNVKCLVKRARLCSATLPTQAIDLHPLNCFWKDLNDGLLVDPKRPLKLALTDEAVRSVTAIGPDARLDLLGQGSMLLGSLLLNVVRTGPARLDLDLLDTVKTWRPVNEKALVRIPFRLASAGGGSVDIKSILVSGPALCEDIDVLSQVRTDDGPDTKPWRMIAGVSKIDEIGCTLRGEPDESLAGQTTEIRIDIQWRDGGALAADWQTKSQTVRVIPRTQKGTEFTRNQGLVCIDFGTTQSSAVLLNGDERRLEGRVIELGIASVENVFDGVLFEDTVVAISSTGELSFGSEARRLEKSAPDSHLLVEDIKWKLNQPDDTIEFAAQTFTNRELVAGFLGHIKKRIEAHPIFGDQIDEAVMTCPAEFENGQTEALAGLFTKVGITPRGIHFAKGESFVSESWPPVVWALSARANEDDGGMLVDRVVDKRVPFGGLSLFSYAEGRGTRKIERPLDFEVVPENAIDEGPIDNTHYESAPHASWLLTFDMGGGSTDLSAIRITKRRQKSSKGLDLGSALEVSDQTRATSARGVLGHAGFVGREFEALAIDTLAARLDGVMTAPPKLTDNVEHLFNCLSQQRQNLSSDVNAVRTKGEPSAVRIARHNFMALARLGEIMRRDDGPFDFNAALFLEECYLDVLGMPERTKGLPGMIVFAQNLKDRMAAASSFDLRDRISRQPRLLSVELLTAKGTNVRRDLDTDWWVETFILLAARMLESRFENEVDRLLKKTLLPAMRESAPTLVISGRAGLFAPARAFAMAKFKHALGSNALGVLALNSDDAKLVTSLGAAYMGRVFKQFSGHAVRFEVTQNTTLCFRNIGFHSLTDISIKNSHFAVHAANLMGLGYRLQALGRDKVAREIATLPAPPNLDEDDWIVWQRQGAWSVVQASCVNAISAHEAAEKVARGEGVVIWTPQ